MTLDYRSGLSVGEICIYSPAVLVGIYLALRPGFGRNWGWYYLILFCLARIIGPAMQLSTLHGLQKPAFTKDMQFPTMSLSRRYNL